MQWKFVTCNTMLHIYWLLGKGDSKHNQVTCGCSHDDVIIVILLRLPDILCSTCVLANHSDHDAAVQACDVIRPCTINGLISVGSLLASGASFLNRPVLFRERASASQFWTLGKCFAVQWKPLLASKKKREHSM